MQFGQCLPAAASNVFGEKLPLPLKPPASLHFIGGQGDLFADKSNPALSISRPNEMSQRPPNEFRFFH